MSKDFDKLIPDLGARIDAAMQQLAQLREARRPHAIDAATGDAEARKAIERIDADIAQATSEAETLALALEEAERGKAEAEAEALAEDRRRRTAEAHRIADEIAGIGKEVDRAATELARCLDERAELIGKLDRTGVVYPGVLRALRNPLRIRAALWVAGLSRHTVLEHVAGHHRKRLSEADVIASTLMAPELDRRENSMEVV